MIQEDKGKGGVVVSDDHGAGKEEEEREREIGRKGSAVKYGRAGGKEMRSKVWGSESAKIEEPGAVSGEEKGCS